MADRCVPYPSAKQDSFAFPRMSDCDIDVDRCDCVLKNSSRSRSPCKRLHEALSIDILQGSR
ncbi:hypothetical protein JZ751_007685 [Albula glossodonta]|uniref:Uncharacterized protein n=1 Tax=Albula glossodonta TaxID=121402 RepID=A0A8T2N9D7_9TELE|nr:hypothetical protein JZ751_007685 [Albula glossodonta]